jgi:D-glycerate 3-kinase
MASSAQQPPNFVLSEILSDLIAGQPQTEARQKQLEAFLLADDCRARAFGINAENVRTVVEQRSRLFQLVYPDLSQFCRATLGWQSCPLELLWELWLPLAMQLSVWQRALGHPLIQGILGGQGTGKTTLAALLTQILSQMKLQVCCLSLDDLYKTYADRLQLQQTDPRLRWRGPPGTHDIELGLTVLWQLHQASSAVEVPRFDKSAWNGAGDRTAPELVAGAEIVLFEGWFVGVRPIDPQAFATAPPPIVTAADRAFARDTNRMLQDYVPLWNQLDRLIVLYPKDYHLSQQWRRQAEQQMVASGRAGMSDREINQFVEYFWRSLHPELFIQPLLQNSDYVDLVIEIDADHSPTAIYRPNPFAD